MAIDEQVVQEHLEATRELCEYANSDAFDPERYAAILVRCEKARYKALSQLIAEFERIGI